MTVYVMVQVEYTDRERYDRYTANFMEVFNQFDGTLLANDEQPDVLEGRWQKDKVALMSFPDKQKFLDWATSDAYRAIVGDRLAGGNATILLVKGMQ